MAEGENYDTDVVPMKRGNMRYAVEFEMQSDADDNVSQAVYKTLVSTFGQIDNFSMVPQRTYVGYLVPGKPFHWQEVGSREASTDVTRALQFLEFPRYEDNNQVS